MPAPCAQALGPDSPDGAGKTTARRMLLGLMRPSSGDASRFDTTIRPGWVS